LYDEIDKLTASAVQMQQLGSGAAHNVSIIVMCGVRS
jgi:hypothetical protein